ncbi:MAG: hypothetical protein KAR35_07155 [Candidatus Heimdallarchaeota archaeon]|nr:hypothetical protein [Candidatus Heimdallarchaeota archaeon]MCK5049137.1 hypothetical protein [Candidatus Heimdallarchaeota archaeon]
MSNSFLIDLLSIQPSQLYINKKKLAKILEEERERVIPIKQLNNKIIFTDGHTRAYAAYIQGKKQITVEWDDEELDWEAYQICVDWCIAEKITTITDLVDKIIEDEEYQILWLERCRVMQEELKEKRAKL